MQLPSLPPPVILRLHLSAAMRVLNFPCPWQVNSFSFFIWQGEKYPVLLYHFAQQQKRPRTNARAESK